jgi:hypothetical protein
MYVELHAYQHHVFMDWRFVDDERWRDIYEALNGAGVESMQAKWDEMFGTKDEGEEMKDEMVKARKPRKKAATKKKTEGDVTPEVQGEKRPRARKAGTTKKNSDPMSTAPKRTTAKKTKIPDKE